MKVSCLDCQRRVDNKQLIQYQMFIKNPSAKSALQRTFLPDKLNEKCIKKYEIATKGSSPQKAVHTIDNNIRKTLEKHPRRSQLSPKQQS